MRHDLRIMLTPEEWRELSDGFGLTLADTTRPMIRSIAVSELLDAQTCAAYLDWMARYIGAPSRRVAASMLAKRYAYLLAAPAAYAMTKFGKALLPELDQCLLITPDPDHEPGRTRFPDLALTDVQVSCPGLEGRDVWREERLQQLFAGHLTPLLRSLSETAKVPIAVLWENVFVRLAPLYAHSLGDTVHGLDDAMYLLHEASPDLYGERRHPFARFIPGSSCDDLGMAADATRRTCCFYYEMSEEYCRKCPLPTMR
ncbi:IucA/IucC family C-terminal-domain containing protein [Paenibacillus sp. 1P07SE]|uniref:IucA/IucC family C-terminal-domain containing protein n=1 Tax=Paenibacillus sp. 1P07SE TaxID=3132209 RepID=UPI0039A6155A